MKPNKRTDLINVVDVESTCWEHLSEQPSGEKSEIIQIGITVLDTVNGKLDGPYEINISPKFSSISGFCTSLTGITAEKLAKTGITFSAACERLVNQFDAQNRVWASFGDYDRKMFFSTAKLHGIGYPFGDRHINLSTITALAAGWTNECGQGKALSSLKMKEEGTRHEAGWDSKNAASLFLMILNLIKDGKVQRQRELSKAVA